MIRSGKIPRLCLYCRRPLVRGTRGEVHAGCRKFYLEKQAAESVKPLPAPSPQTVESVESEKLWCEEFALSSADTAPRSAVRGMVVEPGFTVEFPALVPELRLRWSETVPLRERRVHELVVLKGDLTEEEMAEGATLEIPLDVVRPQTRAECRSMPRPCPFVSCKFHLYLNVDPTTGAITLNFPDLEVWELKETCVLDVADRQGITLEQVSEILDLTRERIRQVEVRGLLKLKLTAEELREFNGAEELLEAARERLLR